MSGTNSEVAGILSAISSMNTEKASSTVMPSVIFSPESGGSQNPRRLENTNIHIHILKCRNWDKVLFGSLKKNSSREDEKNNGVKINE